MPANYQQARDKFFNAIKTHQRYPFNEAIQPQELEKLLRIEAKGKKVLNAIDELYSAPHLVDPRVLISILDNATSALENENIVVDHAFQNSVRQLRTNLYIESGKKTGGILVDIGVNTIGAGAAILITTIGICALAAGPLGWAILGGVAAFFGMLATISYLSNVGTNVGFLFNSQLNDVEEFANIVAPETNIQQTTQAIPVVGSHPTVDFGKTPHSFYQPTPGGFVPNVPYPPAYFNS